MYFSLGVGNLMQTIDLAATQYNTAPYPFRVLCGTDAKHRWIGQGPVVKVQIAENFPQGLKPSLDLLRLAARLKSCPFKTRLSPQAVQVRIDRS
jgi:hypothetical protein